MAVFLICYNVLLCDSQDKPLKRLMRNESSRHFRLSVAGYRVAKLFEIGPGLLGDGGDQRALYSA
jgi:hypothetical protein